MRVLGTPSPRITRRNGRPDVDHQNHVPVLAGGGPPGDWWWITEGVDLHPSCRRCLQPDTLVDGAPGAQYSGLPWRGIDIPLCLYFQI